jgi:hypothetical protein
MADTEFIELQKSRLIQNIERYFAMPVPPRTSGLNQPDTAPDKPQNEAATKISKRQAKSK